MNSKASEDNIQITFNFICDYIPSDLPVWSEFQRDSFYQVCKKQYDNAPNFKNNKYLYVLALSESRNLKKIVSAMLGIEFAEIEEVYTEKEISLFREIEIEAKQGNLDAQVVLGYFYRNGHFVFQDNIKAKNIFEKLLSDARILQSYPGMLCELGNMYSNRFNKDFKNDRKALKLYERGFNEYNQAECQMSLGLAYLSGTLGLEKDIKKAEALILPIALKGRDTLSEWVVFDFYANPDSELYDSEQAQQWFCRLDEDSMPYKRSAELYPQYMGQCNNQG